MDHFRTPFLQLSSSTRTEYRSHHFNRYLKTYNQASLSFYNLVAKNSLQTAYLTNYVIIFRHQIMPLLGEFETNWMAYFLYKFWIIYYFEWCQHQLMRNASTFKKNKLWPQLAFSLCMTSQWRRHKREMRICMHALMSVVACWSPCARNNHHVIMALRLKPRLAYAGNQRNTEHPGVADEPQVEHHRGTRHGNIRHGCRRRQTWRRMCRHREPADRDVLMDDA